MKLTISQLSSDMATEGTDCEKEVGGGAEEPESLASLPLGPVGSTRVESGLSVWTRSLWKVQTPSGSSPGGNKGERGVAGGRMVAAPVSNLSALETVTGNADDNLNTLMARKPQTLLLLRPRAGCSSCLPSFRLLRQFK